MTYHVTHGQLSYAIGGSFAVTGYPMYPVWDSSTSSDYTYYGTDSNWFIFTGMEDPIFYGPDSIQEAEDSFAILAPSAPTIQYSVAGEEIGHDQDCRFFGVMMDFVKDGTVTSIEDYDCASSKIDAKDVFMYVFYLAIIGGAVAFFVL